MPKYNIALLCSDEDQVGSLCEISQNLAKIAKSPYILGKTSFPHVSITHFSSEEASIKNIWEEVKNINIDFTLISSRYYWRAPVVNNYGLTGLEVDKTDKIVFLQEQITKILGEIKVISGYGNSFFPHFTLGYNKLDNNPNILAVMQPDDRLWQQPISVHLAIGKRGENGEFEEIIFQQKTNNQNEKLI